MYASVFNVVGLPGEITKISLQIEELYVKVKLISDAMYVCSRFFRCLDVCHSSTHRLALALKSHRSAMEQGSSSREHVNQCWIVSFSSPHLQITLVDGSAKPHFFSSVFVLATPEQRWLRQRHIFHSSCDPGGKLSLGLIFK